LPFATVLPDKTAVDETHPNFIGVFGQFGKPHGELEAYVEAADCVLIVGAYKTDFTVTAFERSKTINTKQSISSHTRSAWETTSFAISAWPTFSRR
jgi:TPP-dependent 2-oxoacid decarboxylase